MFLLGFGLAAGVAIGMSAIAQGKASASGSDALGETGRDSRNTSRSSAL
jgi:V/A-type H+-transporting ATPase subunit K